MIASHIPKQIFWKKLTPRQRAQAERILRRDGEVFFSTNENGDVIDVLAPDQAKLEPSALKAIGKSILEWIEKQASNRQRPIK